MFFSISNIQIQDEPMNEYLEMDDCAELEEYATKNIGEHCSFKALNARGEIIGVAMNGIIKKPVSILLFISFQCY